MREKDVFITFHDTLQYSMIRLKIIRFFISSTFLDMQNEREKLKTIFKRLNAKYSVKGWKIESVDLRWGISKAQQESNRTMKICLEEVDRCRYLSPKPNFIILLGQRYGWIPLPQVLTTDEISLLRESADKRFVNLINKIYRFDSNAPAGGHFELLGVNESEVDYTNPKIESLLKKYIYQILPNHQLSATHREILRGVLGDSMPYKHTIAYLRKYTDIPQDLMSIYIQDEKLVDSLKEVISKIIPSCIKVEKKYGSLFDSNFESEMERLITSMIDAEINEYEQHLPSENDVHLDLAQRLSQSFYGRKNEIAQIMSYINSDERLDGKVLVVKGSNGVGKTMLMSKIVDLLSNSTEKYDVACRFCDDLEFASASKFIESVKIAVQSLSPNKRCVLVIDGIESVEHTSVDGRKLWNLTAFLDSFNLPFNFRVIITLSEEHTWYDTSLAIEMKVDSLLYQYKSYTTDYLASINRTLTETQLAQWYKDCYYYGYIYFQRSGEMAMATTLLGRMRSWDSYRTALPPDPTKIDSLASETWWRVTLSYLRNCLNDAEVDKIVAIKALKVIATSNRGVPEDVLLYLINNDKDIQAHLREIVPTTSVLDLVRAIELPPMLWSRILTTFDCIIGYRNTSHGVVIDYKNEELRESVRASYGILPEQLLLVAISYNFSSTSWTLNEQPHLFELLALSISGDIENSDCSYTAEELLDLVYSAICFPDNLYELLSCHEININEYFKCYSAIIKILISKPEQISYCIRNIQRVHKQVMSLNEPSNLDQMIRMIGSSCTDSPLYKYFASFEELQFEKDVLLRNLIESPRDAISYYVEGIYEPAIVSANSKRVAYIENDTLVIKDYDNFTSIRESMNFRPDKLIADALFSTFFVYGDDGARYIKIADKADGTTYCIHIKESPQWADISSDGRFIVLGSQDIVMKIYDTKHFGRDPILTFKEPYDRAMWADNTHLWISKGQFLYFSRVLPFENHGKINFGYNVKLKAVSGNRAFVHTDDGSGIFIELVNNNFVFHKFKYNPDPRLKPQFVIDPNGPKIFVITIDGCCTSIDYSGDEVSYLYSTCYGDSNVSGGLHDVLSIEQGIVYDLAKCDEITIRGAAGTGGVNNISADVAGNIIAITCGKNFLHEIHESFDIYIRQNGKYECNTIHTGYSAFPTACAVSPDGRYVAYSTAGRIYIAELTRGLEFTEVDWRGLQIAHMKFTSDNNRLIAVCGEYIADGPANVLIIDASSVKLIGEYTPDDFFDALLRMEFFMNEDNTKIIFDHGGIFDLEKLQYVNVQKHWDISLGLKHKSGYSITEDLYPFGTFDKTGTKFFTNRLGLKRDERLSEIDLNTGEITIISDYKLRVLSASSDGLFLWCADVNNRLVRYCLATDEIKTYDFTDVFKVFIQKKDTGERIWIILNSGDIYLTDSHCNILKSGYADGRRWCITDAGLCIASDNGSLTLLSGD